jgi:hypothetical protein
MICKCTDFIAAIKRKIVKIAKENGTYPWSFMIQIFRIG